MEIKAFEIDWPVSMRDQARIVVAIHLFGTLPLLPDADLRVLFLSSEDNNIFFCLQRTEKDVIVVKHSWEPLGQWHQTFLRRQLVANRESTGAT